jgi:hypothetical protein
MQFKEPVVIRAHQSSTPPASLHIPFKKLLTHQHIFTITALVPPARSSTVFETPIQITWYISALERTESANSRDCWLMTNFLLQSCAVDCPRPWLCFACCPGEQNKLEELITNHSRLRGLWPGGIWHVHAWTETFHANLLIKYRGKLARCKVIFYRIYFFFFLVIGLFSLRTMTPVGDWDGA